MVTFSGSLVQSCCGEGGTLRTHVAGAGGERAVSRPRWVRPAHGPRAFPVSTAQAPGCSAGEMSGAGPGLHALPRSKPLRFRFSGTPQRRGLGRACVLCPSQVRALRRPGARRVQSPQVGSASDHLPVPAARLPGCAVHAPPLVCRVSGCDPPGGSQPSGIPRSLG